MAGSLRDGTATVGAGDVLSPAPTLFNSYSASAFEDVDRKEFATHIRMRYALSVINDKYITSYSTLIVGPDDDEVCEAWENAEAFIEWQDD